MKGRLILLSKDNTDHPAIIDTIPTSILPAVTKFFESSILHNLEILTSNEKMSKNQRGFTKGKSTIDNIKDLLSIGMNLKNNTNNCFLWFVKSLWYCTQRSVNNKASKI